MLIPGNYVVSQNETDVPKDIDYFINENNIIHSSQVINAEKFSQIDSVRNEYNAVPQLHIVDSLPCSAISDVEREQEYVNAIYSDQEHIKYFKDLGISPIIVDSGATSVTFTDIFLFDRLSKNNNPLAVVSMGSHANTQMINGIGTNFLFPKINHVHNLMWNLISLGVLTQYPLFWKHSGENKDWIFYDSDGNIMLKTRCYNKNVFYLTQEYTEILL